MRGGWRLALAGLAGSLPVVASAAADPSPAPEGPSFDCAAARTDVETAICADRQAATADRRMAATYQATLAAAPAAFGPALRETQRSFLDYLAVLCRRPDGIDADCLRYAMDARSIDLRDRAVRRDGESRRLVQLITYAALPYRPPARRRADANDYAAPQRLVILDQIGEPATEAERHWNQLAREKLAAFVAGHAFTASDAGVKQYSLRIAVTAPGFIEAGLSSRGDPHLGVDEPWHWLLAADRPLRPDDLFDNPAKAFDAIARLVRADMLISAAENPDEKPVPSLARTRRAVANLANWVIGQGELPITVDGQPFTAHGATLNWSQLGPLLRRDPAFDPTRLSSPSEPVAR